MIPLSAILSPHRKSALRAAQNIPVLALTATANKRVEADILQQIGVETQVVRGTMQRPNLYLNVVRVSGDHEKLSYLAEILPTCPGTGIIYTATKHDAEMVATFLLRNGIEAEYYHAGREDSVRQDIEQKLMNNQYKVVCSTNALGMGIDKPDVRFVIHYHVPASPIHYYQEMGRAGREGKVSWCFLLYDPGDLVIQEYFIRNGKPDGKCYAAVLSLLQIRSCGMYDVIRATGFAQTAVRNILADLEEQGFIKRNSKDRIYTALPRLGKVDFSTYDAVQSQKKQELSDIRNYAQTDTCYMEYLTTYLGDEPGYRCRTCGLCRKSNFPVVRPSERIQGAAVQFLEEDFLPRIEKQGNAKHPMHEAGWSLSYHGNSRIGKLVRASKYEDAGPFALGLVYRAIEVIRTRYPLEAINGIVSVPPTKSGTLVEMYARQVAAMLGVEYLSVLVKMRPTREQKYFSNWLQKADNVKGAFSVSDPGRVVGCTLLLIDDIYDSGYMLREVGQTLMQAGATAVYPLTITRTMHSDNQ